MHSDVIEKQKSAGYRCRRIHRLTKSRKPLKISKGTGQNNDYGI